MAGRAATRLKELGALGSDRLGGLRVALYPIYHPAAALYTPAMLRVLEEDFRRIPELLGRTIEPELQPGPGPAAEAEPVAAPIAPHAAVQLGLF